jgi:RND family efflux transporter MFP subunit
MTSLQRFFTALAPLAAAALAVGCGHDEPRTAGVELEPISATVAEVEVMRENKSIEVRGVVQPARQADVSSRVTGPVVALRVNSGSVVAKGQTLLEIQPEVSGGQLSQAEGALAQAQATLLLAQRNYERYQSLHAENAASDLELDMARMQYGQAKGAVKQAEGAVRSAQAVANESAVMAPYPARVIRTLVEVGDLVAPGRPLVRIESLEDQQLWLTVREGDASRVEIGDTLDIRIDARPDFGTVTGKVEEIVPSADPATHTVTVKVGLDSLQIPSGFSGRASIAGDPVERLAVPRSAVHQRGGLELAIVRADDGSARTRAVTTGEMLPDERVEVLSGLAVGEQVVVDAPGPVTDGTPLEVER